MAVSGGSREDVTAREGNTDKLTELHAAGVDLSASDEIGKTPAIIAAENRQVEVIEELRGLGVDVPAEFREEK